MKLARPRRQHTKERKSNWLRGLLRFPLRRTPRPRLLLRRLPSAILSLGRCKSWGEITGDQLLLARSATGDDRYPCARLDVDRVRVLVHDAARHTPRGNGNGRLQVDKFAGRQPQSVDRGLS